jgi:uncharacterized protein (DUF934 family)
MRRIIKGRELVADDWHYAGKDEGEPGPDAKVALPLAEFLAARASGANAGMTALRLVPTDLQLDALQPLVASIPLVVVEFASTGDGRGYTQARLLRERFGYKGELRAIGGVRADQLFLLARCGFDAFDLAAGEKPEIALAQLDRFSVAYQDTADGVVHPRHRYGQRV